MPKVSVLMSVYNGEKYLKEAMDSILSQSFKDFEFIIINDGSTDKSLQIIDEYNDDRIKCINNEENKGLTYSLNKGIELSNGEYIVRMDADDISYGNRIERQVKLMDQQPSVVLSGSAMDLFYKLTRLRKKSSSLVENNQIQSRLLFRNAIGHPTVIMRGSTIKDNQLKYDENLLYAEDYGMWTQLADYGEITNISESLLLYRIVPNSLTSQSKRNIEQRKRVYKEIISSKLTRLKIEPTKHIDLHFELAEIHNLKLTKYTLDDYQAYLTNLIEANKKEQYFDETSLKMECAAQFYNCCVVKGDFKSFYHHEFNQILNVNRAKFYKDRLIFIGKKQVKRKVRS